MLLLNSCQLKAREKAIKWFKKPTKQVHEIVGPAGSGKTTIVKSIIEHCGLKREEVLFMAFVGKATQALAMKGNLAKTVHASIYEVVDVPRYDDTGLKMYKNGRVVTRKGFVKKESLDPNIKLLVVDEGGMIDKIMGPHILSFGIPTLVLGDLDQLPPIFGKSFFLQNPDSIIKTVMRQAEGSPILDLADIARKQSGFKPGMYGNCRVITQDQLTDELLMSADIVISGTNRTRDYVNTYIRQKILKRDPYMPLHVGDKIVCRQNNWGRSLSENIYLINGMIGYVDNVRIDTLKKRSVNVDFRPDFTDDTFMDLSIDLDYLYTPCYDKSGGFMSAYNKFQFGYGITCHMSQGSQYHHVIYIRERLGSTSFQSKLDYTAITRAEEIITIVI